MFRRGLFNVGRQSVRLFSMDADASGSKLVMTGERGVNKVTLLGRCGRQAEMRGTEQHPVTLFPLATSISLKRPDGTYEQKTQWHKIAVFRPGLRDFVLSTVAQGDRVFVTGSINYSSYESDGQTKSSTTIIADEVINVTAKKSRSTGTED